jgi:LPS-assembly protein
LFYLYVPFRDQDDIPLFDTTDIDRSYSWLFLDNRFTGADRLGDANQLTAALTSRFIDPDSGRERFYVSVGQIHYFEDREVLLEPDDLPETSSTSGPIAETRIALTDSLALRGSMQWDPELDNTRRSALDLRYQPDDGQLLGLSHRFARDTLEQIDFAFLWPIDEQWRILGRWNYSLDTSRSMDVFAGVEYDDCCWALRMVARDRRVDPGDEDTRASFYLQVELKGLANVGRNIDSLLRDTILGYNSLGYR